MEKLKLVEPTKEHEERAIEYINELIEYNSIFDGCNDLNKYIDNYDGWLDLLEHDRNEPINGRVPAITFFLIREDDNKILGMINLRLELNDFLFNIGGNIGYNVRPTERKKGYNYYQLKKTLEYAKNMNLEKVLITCDENNIASKNSILKVGGELDNIAYYKEENINVLRFWVDTNIKNV